jgi:hypothetical protein
MGATRSTETCARATTLASDTAEKTHRATSSTSIKSPCAGGAQRAYVDMYICLPGVNPLTGL